ncbi:hypothetical protein [Cohnella sp. AR92]|uniref:hypothetical protein n=1 Tax=Cohnella sp. AR92 TaxID=648716 RepID=UPI000F8C7D32|nr:hypothetical protein [Cohnella sp. AR92]RUS48170.1 hypothetical protein ELR57_06470 [Cohnella sp. AR92]
MGRAKAGLLLASVSMLAVLLLAQLSKLGGQMEAHRPAPAVFAPMSVQTMTKESMVDAFAGLRLESKLSRLTWENGILTVDLTAGEGRGARLAIWEDAASLVDLCFVKVHNVRQLLIRVFEDSQGKKTMLLSADTRARDWDVENLVLLQRPIRSMEPEWAGKLRAEWTRAGEGWKRDFAK